MNTGKWKRWTSVLVIMILIVSGLVPYAAAYDEYTVITEETETEIIEDETGDAEALPEEEVDEAEAILTDETEVWNDEDPAEEPADAIVDSPVTEEEITEDSTLTTEDIAEVEADTADEPEEEIIEPETELDTETAVTDDEESLDEEQLEEITAVMETVRVNSLMLFGAADMAGSLTVQNVVNANSAQSLTRKYIVSQLGEAANFAVFAKEFHNRNHLEGTIAVERLTGDWNSQIGDSSNTLTNHTAYEVLVEKTVDGDVSDSDNATRNFTFGVFKKNGNSYTSLDNTVTVSVTGRGTGTGTLSGNFDNQTELYIFELDGNGNPITDKTKTNVTIGTEQFTVTYTDKLRDSSGGYTVQPTGNVSYIKELAGSGGSNMFNHPTGANAKLIIGSGNQLKDGENGHPAVVGTSGATYQLGEGVTVSRVSNNADFSINFAESFKTLTALSSDLATLSSGSDVVVYNITATSAGLSNDLTKERYDLNKNADKFTVVNIDCTNFDGTYLLDHAVSDTNTYANAAASRILYNFLTKDGSQYSAWKNGKVLAKEAVGTLLLPAGELTNVEGYYLGTVIAEKVSHDNAEIHRKNIYEGSTTGVATVTNAKTGGTIQQYPITVKKVDQNGAPLAGAVLSVKNSVTGADVVRFTTTGADYYTFNVQPGSYTLNEDSAPDGYELAAAINFTVDGSGNVKLEDGTAVSAATLVMTDRKSTPQIGVLKCDAEKVDEANNTYPPLEGATLRIEKNNGDLVDEFVTTAAVKYFELPEGYYVLKETSAPAGYKLAGEIAFYVNPDGELIIDGQKCDKAVLLMRDEPVRYSVKIRKVNENNEPLSGAELEIKDSEGIVVDSFKTDSSDHEIQLRAGEYTLSETSAPEGYALADDINFTVETDGTVKVAGETLPDLTVVMKDELKPDEFTVKVKKVDGCTPSKLVKGAELTVTDEKGNFVTRINTSDANPAELSLAPGAYTLTETQVPSGYYEAKPIRFEVSREGKVSVNGEEVDAATIVMKDAPKGKCSLEIWKTIGNEDDSDLKNLSDLPNDIVFIVEGDNGFYKEVPLSRTDEYPYPGAGYRHYLNDLPEGRYKVTEKNGGVTGYAHTVAYYPNSVYWPSEMPNKNNAGSQYVDVSSPQTRKVKAWDWWGYEYEYTETSISKMWIDNIYKNGVTANLKATKTLVDGDLKEGQFSFELRPITDKAPMPDGTRDGVYTVSNGSSGSINFGDITFPQEGRSYEYEITEKLPWGVDEAHPASGGIVYDRRVIQATVQVYQSGGQWQTSVAYKDVTNNKDVTTAEFVNHLATGELVLKKVNGQDGLLEAVRDGKLQKIYDEVAFKVMWTPEGSSSAELYENTGDSAGYWRPDPETGLIKLENLKPGTYEISEVESPEDYMDLPGAIKIQVTGNGTIKRLDAPSNYVHWNDENIDNPDDATSVKYTSSTEVTGKTLLVRNYPNINLPETGRNSRWYCFLFGSLITLAGIILLFTGRGNRKTPDLEGSAGGGFRA